LCHCLESVHLLGDAGLKFSLEKLILDFNPAITRVRIDRKVSRCTIVESRGLEVIELHQQVGYLRCPLERIVNQSWVAYLIVEKYGVVCRPPVLDKEKDELIFENAVKSERSSCVEEEDEDDDDNDENEEEEEEEEEEEGVSVAESNDNGDEDEDDGEDDNASDSDDSDRKTVIPLALKEKTN
jgi:hypothetical protein